MFNRTRTIRFLATVAASCWAAAALAGDISTRFTAALTASEACDCDISGQAVYRDDGGRRRFNVEVEGFPAGTDLVVEVGGENVGTLSVRRGPTGALISRLVLDDKIEDGITDNPRTMFPANFPTVLAGSSVVVGPLTGSFGLTSISGGDGTGGGGTAPGEVAAGDLECRVQLAGEDASMDADFRNENGRMRFDVSLEAAPGGSFAVDDRVNVTVGGSSVGTFTLGTLATGDVGAEFGYDSNFEAGDVTLPFPVDFPGVAIGTVVAIEPVVPGAPALACEMQPK